jgi:hypothetical protein
MTAVLDADPDLRDDLAGSRLSSARSAAVATMLSLGPGPCDLAAAMGGPDGLAFGLLVVSGLLVCELRVAATHGIEFVGPGDLVQRPPAPVAGVPIDRCWYALCPSRLAVLDGEFATRVRPWPEITNALLRRAGDRSEALAYQLAARHAVRVEDRLLLIVVQLAARWGRVTPEGTVLRIPGLNHEMLARAVGARRSPVTKALGDLKRRDLMEIRPGGEIVVRPGARLLVAARARAAAS